MTVLTLFFRSLLIFVLCAMGLAHAQSYQTDFETWAPSGKQPPFDWFEPQGWRSTNAVTEFMAAGITKSTDAHGGVASCKLRTLPVFGTPVPGAIVLGTPKLDFSTYSLVAVSGGIPCTSHAGVLNGYYKYASTSAGDSAWVVVLLKHYNAVLGKRDTTLLAQKALGPASAWTAFELMATETPVSSLPDSLIIGVYSSKPHLSPVLGGGELWVDDLAFTPLTGTDDRKETNGAVLYPNPATDNVAVQLPSGITHGVLRIFDLTGRQMAEFPVTAAQPMVLPGLKPGIYGYEVAGQTGRMGWGRLVVE